MELIIKNLEVLNTTTIAMMNVMKKEDQRITMLSMAVGLMLYMNFKNERKLNKRIDELEKIVEQQNIGD